MRERFSRKYLIAPLATLQFLLRRHEPKNRIIDNQIANPNNSKNESWDDVPTEFAKTEQKDWRPEERHHHRIERRYWCAWTTLTAFTAIGAVTAAIFAGLALKASWQAVHEAAKTTAETRRQADAAEKQARISRDVGERQLRAYISVEPKGPVENITTTTVARVAIRLRNSGQTPAYNLVSRAVISLGPEPLPFDETFSLYPSQQPPSIIVLDPKIDDGGQFVFADKPYTVDQIESIKSGTITRIYVFGTETYQDAFGFSHYTNFCFSFFGGVPITSGMEYCSKHNNAN